MEQTRGRSQYSGVYEHFFCDMERSVFSRIAEAGRINYRIGSTKGRLSKAQRAALAALAEKIEDAKEIVAERG